MAEYKEIHGTKIRNYTTNPDNPITGEVWYNETDDVLKFQYPNTTTGGSWRAANSLNTGRSAAGAAGIQTSAVYFGGEDPSAGVDNTETYNGTVFTEVNDMNASKNYPYSAGTDSEAALSFLGEISLSNTTNTEVWNGTNWTEVNNANTGRRLGGSSGTETAALAFGGFVSAVSALTEYYNGTNWTELNDLNAARYGNIGAKNSTYTASLSYGGFNSTSARQATTES